MTAKRILLIVGGGIAAYKSLELVRELRRAGIAVTAVLTEAGKQFVTPLSLAALTENPVYEELFSLKDETEMGHIQLSRQADLVVVCPATANLLSRMVAGAASDLASTLLLATDTPVLAVPAMNVRMWQHAATRRNVAQLRADGVAVMEPDEGEMACGEFGPGRLPEVPAIVAMIRGLLEPQARPLAGKRALVTAGPTHEPIDPVRYIANRSSGKQGFAIAAALAAAGAEVALVAGPVALPTPAGVRRIDVETAQQMAAAVDAALPADIAVMVAAVADWRTDPAAAKIKKGAGGPPALALVENPDILAAVAAPGPRRPALVVGFAAETDTTVEHGRAKLAKKRCDWIVANDVSGEVMGGATNRVHLITADGVEDWPEMAKVEVAAALVARIAERLAPASASQP
jgi:phosphopantothenoylcysteine decarboxylase/phosphopantothenate--cysteine ligase